jgi:hypothetical protein
MSGFELFVAHAVKLALLALLLGMLWRGRVRQCWSFGAYVIAILAGNTLVSLWPARFLIPSFWIFKQTVYDSLKLAIALELLYRTLKAFPGTWRAARLVVLALLSVSAIALVLLATSSSYLALWEWQPSVVTAAVWLLTATALLVMWYQIPVQDWPRAILLGFTPYLLVFLTLVDLLRRHGWNLNRRIGIVDSLAYLALVVFWARAAWRHEPAGALAKPSNGLTVPEGLATPHPLVARGGLGDMPGSPERLA